MSYIETIINNSINLILWPILFGAVVIMFIYAGIMFVISTGDPSKVTAARTAVTFAIIGLIIGVLAFSVTKILGPVFGIGT